MLHVLLNFTNDFLNVTFTLLQYQVNKFNKYKCSHLGKSDMDILLYTQNVTHYYILLIPKCMQFMLLHEAQTKQIINKPFH